MGNRDLTPVHVPLRTSSRTPVRHDPMEKQGDLGLADRRASKAQRFFGTDISLPKEHGGWQEAPNVARPSFIKPSTSAPKQNSGFVPFPSSSDNALIPEQNLRVRASSPLLCQHFQPQDIVPPLPKSSRKVHHSGSSSALFSYFSSKESSKSPKNQGLQPRVRNGLSIDPQVTYTHAPDLPKESKRKNRPSRIDLSVLFPKPRNPQQQTLLSPHRMVDSPSPVSTVVPEGSPDKTERTTGANKSSTKGYIDVPLRRSSVPKNHLSKHGDDSDLPSITETENSEWLEPSFERTVGTSEIDLALDRYAARRPNDNARKNLAKVQDVLKAPQPSQNGNAPKKLGKVQDVLKAPHLSQNGNTLKKFGKVQDVLKAPHLSQNGNAPKKLGKVQDVPKAPHLSQNGNTLKKFGKVQDVLPVHLSRRREDEDEDEDEEQTPTTEPKRNGHKLRDSVDIYGEYEPEVYTASTARAASATAVRRFERAHSTSSRGSHQTEQSLPMPVPVPRPRKVSQSSSGKSSQTTRRTTQTPRSSGVPTIPDELLAQFPQQPSRTPAELKELNRRSRVIAVTRQEQDLLEAMRIRKGKVTPSLFNVAGADTRSLASGLSRDSFCGTDTSFLRLSNVFPPFDGRSEKSATHYKDGSLSQSSGSDSGRKPSTALSSPGFSADYSESLPSPSTSGASPLTPTLPIHRFSPLPSPKPPPRGPPPAIPDDQKQHTRRRTDSSEAILLHDRRDSKGDHGLPVWSFDFDWNQERANIATVH
ncbi:hypothetical protein N7457_007450 [Penicillium paradoxum]|uniref:uncharacterized protein n=1 Tax=Penicillium paradoxum TaxID=176176 RepID=UPI0025495578|nr:uncharacterized protein N7457_007450 [Penicillium paradoxum]KAJ5779730.1 hypothetical protein N7457_007450 [Penicillium paradoxum]